MLIRAGDNKDVVPVVTSAVWAQAAKRAASEAGFELCGVASLAGAPPQELTYFSGWVESGQGGEMKYLESRTESGELKRTNISHVADWARSVVVCAINYNAKAPYSTEVKDARRGWISRYAWFRRDGEPKPTADYHDVVMKRLKKVESAIREFSTLRPPRQTQNGAPTAEEIQTRCYVDTGPLVERVWAKYAGVGWMGKNTCIIHEQQGSLLFLGVILTSAELQPDLPAMDRCGSCTRCLEACPTEAFTAPYQMDARRCIAYLTIEKRGDIPQELRVGMGNNIFGCDICQDVCPWNRPQRTGFASAPEFVPDQRLIHPDLAQLAEMSEDKFREMFRNSPVKRAKFSGLRRNVAVAMGNSGVRSFLPLLERMAGDSDVVVAEHARWAMERLRR